MFKKVMFVTIDSFTTEIHKYFCKVGEFYHRDSQRVFQSLFFTTEFTEFFYTEFRRVKFI